MYTPAQVLVADDVPLPLPLPPFIILRGGACITEVAGGAWIVRCDLARAVGVTSGDASTRQPGHGGECMGRQDVPCWILCTLLCCQQLQADTCARGYAHILIRHDIRAGRRRAIAALEKRRMEYRWPSFEVRDRENHAITSRVPRPRFQNCMYACVHMCRLFSLCMHVPVQAMCVQFEYKSTGRRALAQY